MLQGTPPEASDFVAGWIGIAARARDRALACDDGTDRQLCCEQETVKLSLDNLMTFPWIAERVASGRLHLHGGHFDIRTGQLSMLGPDGTFACVPASVPG
jgi:carbonic anhydrase